MLYSYNMSTLGSQESDIAAESGVDEIAVDRVFKALGHRTRRTILDLLRDAPRTTGELCAAFPDLDRCTTMQHVGVLERADLVVAHRNGRERWNHLNVLPIKDAHDRWIGGYATAAVDLLAALERDG